MRIAIDAMGGDHAPAEVIRGAVEAVPSLAADDVLVLVGLEDVIERHLSEHADVPAGKIAIHAASEVIGMNEAPMDAIRQRKDSSITVMARLAAEGGVDAVISAGNTGAFAAACQLKMRTLGVVQRPGIGVVLPSFYGPLTVCDVGANVAPKPHHLYQYAHMATVYSERILGIDNPRVALLSIGGEDIKGNSLVKHARQLIRDDSRLNYVGNIEGRDLYRGVCDVVVCDGFVGNVVLKLSEGLSEGLFYTIEREIAATSPDLAEQFKPVVQAIWAKHDYSEYGGAPLLGVDGVCIICHGASDHRAIRNAIRVARDIVQSDLNSDISARLAQEPVDV